MSVLANNSSAYKSNQQQFAFQNLQPINYLKQFNKMLDYMNKAPPGTISKAQKQLRIVKLSKFPLHQYYYQMQGILQSTNKKSLQLQKNNKEKIQFQKLEEKFLGRHYKFVKDTLEKIIQDNQTQQKHLEKQKIFFKKDLLNQNLHLSNTIQLEERKKCAVRLVKLRSQPKLRNTKHNLYTTDSGRNASAKASARNLQFKKGQDMKIEQSQYKQQNKGYSSLRNQTNFDHPIFKKLIPPKKDQKYRERRLDQIDHLLLGKISLEEKKRNMTQHPLTERVSHVNKNSQTIKKGSNTGHNYNKKYEENSFKNIKKYSFQNQQSEKEQSFHVLDEQDLALFKKQISMGSKVSNKQVTNKKDSSLNASQEEVNIEDDDTKFFKDIQTLQDQQRNLQKQYGTRIDNKIKQTKIKLNQRIQRIKSFDFSISPIPTQKQREIKK